MDTEWCVMKHPDVEGLIVVAKSAVFAHEPQGWETINASASHDELVEAAGLLGKRVTDETTVAQLHEMLSIESRKASKSSKESEPA